MYFTFFKCNFTLVKGKLITFVNQTFYKIKMTKSVAERIAEIIKMEDLTNSQFAQLIGIQPSAVTHLLSGRNAPSLQVIQKILDTFRGISPEWFVSGIGDMYRKSPEQIENKTDTIKKQPSYPYQQSLFPEIPIPTQEYGKENEINSNDEGKEKSGTTELRYEQTPNHQPEFQNPQNTQWNGTYNNPPQQPMMNTPVQPQEEKREKPEPTPVAPRIVKKIIVFYSDNTYEEYGAQLNN